MTSITPPGPGFFNTNGVIKADAFRSPTESDSKTQSNTSPDAANIDAAVVSPARAPVGGTYQNEIIKGAKTARTTSSPAPATKAPPANTGAPAQADPAPVNPITTQPVGTPRPVREVEDSPPGDRSRDQRQVERQDRRTPRSKGRSRRDHS